MQIPQAAAFALVLSTSLAGQGEPKAAKPDNQPVVPTVEDVAANVEIPEEQFAIPGPVKMLQVGLPAYMK